MKMKKLFASALLTVVAVPVMTFAADTKPTSSTDTTKTATTKTKSSKHKKTTSTTPTAAPSSK
jgi:hypothetical protein